MWSLKTAILLALSMISPSLDQKWFCCNLTKISYFLQTFFFFFSSAAAAAGAAAASTRDGWKQKKKKRWFVISPPAPRSRTLLLPPRSRCHTSGPRRALWPRACCTNTCRHLSPDWQPGPSYCTCWTQSGRGTWEMKYTVVCENRYATVAN